jgi:hypothetical protein
MGIARYEIRQPKKRHGGRLIRGSNNRTLRKSGGTRPRRKNDVHMSKIAQTVVAHERRLLSFGGVVVRRVAMSESDQFRQYAEEALLWAAQSKTKEEKQLLLELVCTWTQAAVVSERKVAGPTIQEPRKDIGLAAGA